MKFNYAGQTFHVIAFDQDGRVSGEAENISTTLSIDGGARDPLGDVTPVEINGTGEYVFDLTKAETKGHSLSFVPVCSTAGVQVLGTPSNVIYTDSFVAGARPVKIKVVDGDENFVPNARVFVQDSEGEPILGAIVTTKTDTGQGEISLDDGEYFGAVGIMAGFTAHAAEAFVISEDDQLIILTVNRISVDAPSAPDLCVCVLTVVDQNGRPIKGAKLATSLEDGTQFVSGSLLHDRRDKPVSDENGVITVELVRTGRYELAITHGSTTKSFSKTIPDQDSLVLTTSL